MAPFMDRDKVTKATAQIGFLEFILIPMFKTVAQVRGSGGGGGEAQKRAQPGAEPYTHAHTLCTEEHTLIHMEKHGKSMAKETREHTALMTSTCRCIHLRTCVYVCSHVCTDAFTHGYVCTHSRVYVGTFARGYVCAHMLSCMWGHWLTNMCVQIYMCRYSLIGTCL